MAYSDHVIYSGNAPETDLASGITDSSSSLTLTTGDGYPSPTGGQIAWIVIDPDTSSEEKVSYTGRSGTELTGLTRGGDDTAASAHTAGAVVRHIFPAQAAEEAATAVRLTVGKITAAGSMLVSDGVNSLAELAVAASRLVGRKASGGIAALTTAELAALFGTPDGTKFLADDGTLKVPAGSGTTAFVGARAYASAPTTMANAALTVVNLTGESYDSATLHDTATNPSRITVPDTGKYLVVARIRFSASAGGSYRAIRILANGIEKAAHWDDPGGLRSVGVDDVIDLTAGDYVQMAGYQDVGSDSDVRTGETETYLTVVKVG